MKNNIKIVIGIVIGVLLSGITVYAATYLSKDVTFSPSDENWNVNNVEDALNELYQNSNNTICPEQLKGTIWNFYYTGNSQIFVAPCSGIYQLEVWGAQGGSVNSSYVGGYGGYSTGLINFNQLDKIYIVVGGAGYSGSNTTIQGGYNGGGTGQSGLSYVYFASGGGATHIAKKDGVLSSLKDYKESILIVAGGGGGSWYQTKGHTLTQRGGSGGGYIGSSASGTVSTSTNTNSTGGSQMVGGSLGSFNSKINIVSGTFGQGGDRQQNCGSGGGGGFFGGGSAICLAGSGGSSYISSNLLISNDKIKKHTTCYSCSTSDQDEFYTINTTNVSDTPISDYAKIGNGYARITLISTN